MIGNGFDPKRHEKRLFDGRVAARFDYDPMYGARLVLRPESPRFLPVLAMREVIATLFSHQEDDDE
jgi:hypothetical protein